MSIPAVPFQYVKDCVRMKRIVPMRDWYGGLEHDDTYFTERTNRSLFPLPDERSREVEEINQSLLEYVNSNWSRPLKPSRRRTIYIQPIITQRKNNNKIDVWSPNSKVFQDRMISFLKAYFDWKVKTMSSLYIIEHKKKRKDSVLVRFTSSKGKKRKRTENIEVKRVRAKKMTLLSVLDLLDVVHAILPTDAYTILGVTDVDIYETDDCMDGSLRGRAFGMSRIAVFSTAPLKRDLSTTIHSISRMDDESKAWSYMLATIAHETLHCFGLDHCGFYRCCMNSWSDTMVEFGSSIIIDGDDDLVIGCLHLCPICIRKLHHCIGFCLKERLSNLTKMYHDLGLKDQEKWCESLLLLL
jgi:predicted Zn-dependent protease